MLDKKIVFQVLKRLKIRNNTRLDLMGGEPLLHPYLFDIVRYAKSLSYIRKIQLYTNGIGLTGDVSKKIKDSGIDNVIVSLFSCNKNIYDTNVGIEGAWENVVKGVGNLVSQGVRTYFLIVVNSKNVDYLDDFEQLSKSLGIKTIYFPYIQQKADDHFCIRDKGKYQDSIRWMFNKSDKYRIKVIEFIKRHKTICNAFPKSLTVTSKGEVKPCPFVRMNFGNIYCQEIDKIIINACFSPDLAGFLAIPKECSGCSIIDKCGGGCKALNYNDKYCSIINTTNTCCGPYLKDINYEDLGEYLPFFE